MLLLMIVLAMSLVLNGPRYFLPVVPLIPYTLMDRKEAVNNSIGPISLHIMISYRARIIGREDDWAAISGVEHSGSEGAAQETCCH